MNSLENEIEQRLADQSITKADIPKVIADYIYETSKISDEDKLLMYERFITDLALAFITSNQLTGNTLINNAVAWSKARELDNAIIGHTEKKVIQNKTFFNLRKI